MEKKRFNFIYGINSMSSRKNVADGACVNQQDFVNAPVTAITQRCGYLKKNTTALGGSITGVYGFKTKIYHVYLASDSAGNINTVA